MESESRQNVLLLLGALALTAALVALGFGLGQRRSAPRFEAILATHAGPETLAELIPPEQRAAVARVYLEPEAVRERFDAIRWTVPYVPVPFIGYAPAPGRHGDLVINGAQMRGARLPRRPKPPGTRRIVVTGGSVAFGSGAPGDDRTVGAFLEAMLNEDGSAGGPRFEVFTLAAPGWTSTHERIAIENRVSELDPDLVVSLSGINDVYLSAIGRDLLWSRSFGDQPFFDLLLEACRAARRPLFADVAPLRDQPPLPAEVAQRLAKNAVLSARALELAGAGFVFALQPNIAWVSKPPSAREKALVDAYRFRAYNQASHGAIDARLRAIHLPGFGYADLSDVFDPLPPGDEVFIDTGHVGDKGNRAIAARLAAEIAPRLGGASLASASRRRP